MVQGQISRRTITTLGAWAAPVIALAAAAPAASASGQQVVIDGDPATYTFELNVPTP